MARVRHDGVVGIIEVGGDERPYVAMELIEGQSLRATLDERRLSRSDVLNVAQGLAAALDHLHRHGVVHRDIKPENVLIAPSGNTKIVDFGFATHVDDDAESEIVGTFLYAAPEQTRMLKRPVDGRSDLYSLGCVLYECVAGVPPFVTADVGELLRRHATVPPKPLRELNPEASPTFAAIIAKLLNKDPDDRYQTAGSLLWDLEHLAELDAQHTAGVELQLGRSYLEGSRFQDVPLIAREREVTRLVEVWRRLRQGRSQAACVVIEGEAGLGKTRLAREMVGVANSDGAPVWFAKAQSGERRPFAVLREALESYLTRPKTHEEREQLAAQMVAAAGDTAGIVRRFSPVLEALLPHAEDVPPLDPESEQERFFTVLTRFLQQIARDAGGMLLVLDDLQWIDEASFAVVRRLHSDASTVPLLVAFTARNDADSKPVVDKLLEELQRDRVDRITLSPLDFQGVDAFVLAHLGGRPLVPELVEKLAARSSGNPFTLGEYIRSLLDQGLIQPVGERWELIGKGIDDVRLPGNVLELLVARIERLGSETLRTLQVAAVYGFVFEERFIASVVGDATAASALTEAHRANLVEPLGNARKGQAGFAFIHDRVREALLEMLPEMERRELHEQLATSIEQALGRDDNYIDALAHHCQSGQRRDKLRLVQVCYAAGRKALAEHSSAVARPLLEDAWQTAEQAGFTVAETDDLRETLGVACARLGALDAALGHYRGALATANHPQQSARLRARLSEAYYLLGRMPEAWDEMQAGLALESAAFPKAKLGQVLTLLGYWGVTLLRVRFGWGYGKAIGKERERRIRIAANLSNAWLLAWFLNDPLRLAQVIIRSMYNAHFLGSSSQNAKAQTTYSIMNALLFARTRSVRAFGGRGLAIARQLGDPETLAAVRGYYGFALEFSGERKEGTKMVEDVRPDAARYCGSWDQTTITVGPVLSRCQSGHARDAVDWGLAHLDAVTQLNSPPFLVVMLTGIYSQLVVLGRMREALVYRERAQRLLVDLPHAFVQSYAWGNEIIALYEQGERGEELETAIRRFHEQGFAEYFNRHVFITIAWFRIEQIRQCSEAERPKRIRAAVKALRTLSWPPVNAGLTPIHEAHIFALRAALAREQGKHSKAERFIARALELADEVGSPWARWVALRERARLAVGDARTASAQQVLEIARQEGWKVREQSVRREFGIEGDAAGGFSRTNLSVSSSIHVSSSISVRGDLGESRRYVSALLDVALASSSSSDPKQQAREALDTAVRLFKAERAYLFARVEDGEELEMLAGRDHEGADLDALAGYASTVVRTAFEGGETQLITGTDEGKAIGSESAIAHNLRSIMAAPLRLRDKTVGVVYLDSRVAKGLFTSSDAEVLSGMGAYLAIALSTAKNARLEARRRELEKDLQLTAAVQSFFLPAAATLETPGGKVSGLNRAATHCSGDWWYVEQPEPGKIVALVGDVTGHGAPSAMVTAIAASGYRLLRSGNSSATVGDILRALNRQLYDIASGGYLMTMTAVTLDTRSGKAEIVNAGGQPVLRKKSDGSVDALIESGTLLGMGPELTVGCVTVDLEEGDRLLVFTDGVTEREDAKGRQLGLKKLVKIMKAAQDAGTEEYLTSIAAAVERSSNAPASDDLTLVVLERCA